MLGACAGMALAGSAAGAQAQAQAQPQAQAPGVGGGAGGAAGRLVVVELFTSQGCSSCPPADAHLVELAQRADVLALSFHVDYWDYIGWKDPYSLPESTARQRAYQRAHQLRHVFTPQMVVQGRAQIAGTERAAIEGMIANAYRLPLALGLAAESGDPPTLTLSATGSLPEAQRANGADVWLIGFDRGGSTQVTKGENAGRTLHNAHVVRSIARIGRVKELGGPMSVPGTTLAGRHFAAILVQAPYGGAILGAARVALR
ncbi:MAG: DUF1223 domain-containing protein [Alphaproteobacteria bacterium]|nr:DUF1223 domain-containing protein [Alphaproteobacteria bacterium]